MLLPEELLFARAQDTVLSMQRSVLKHQKSTSRSVQNARKLKLLCRTVEAYLPWTLYQHFASRVPTHQIGWMDLLISVLDNHMMIAIGWNQSVLDLDSFPESHLYHTQPDQTPDIGILFNIL